MALKRSDKEVDTKATKEAPEEEPEVASVGEPKLGLVFRGSGWARVPTSSEEYKRAKKEGRTK